MGSKGQRSKRNKIARKQKKEKRMEAQADRAGALVSPERSQADANRILCQELPFATVEKVAESALPSAMAEKVAESALPSAMAEQVAEAPEPDQPGATELIADQRVALYNTLLAPARRLLEGDTVSISHAQWQEAIDYLKPWIEGVVPILAEDGELLFGPSMFVTSAFLGTYGQLHLHFCNFEGAGLLEAARWIVMAVDVAERRLATPFHCPTDPEKLQDVDAVHLRDVARLQDWYAEMKELLEGLKAVLGEASLLPPLTYDVAPPSHLWEGLLMQVKHQDQQDQDSARVRGAKKP